MAAGRPHLAVVATPPAPGLQPVAPRRVSLRGAPWRPGELPGVLALELRVEVVDAVCEQARRAAVPVEVWLRATIDGAHVLDEICEWTGSERAVVSAGLDRAASAASAALGVGGPLSEYARLLVRGEAGSVTSVARDRRVELCLPAEVELAWRLAAATRAQSIQAWAVERAVGGEGDALCWEAAAAATGRRLSEWGYAVFLSASSAARAWPQLRT